MHWEYTDKIQIHHLGVSLICFTQTVGISHSSIVNQNIYHRPKVLRSALIFSWTLFNLRQIQVICLLSPPSLLSGRILATFFFPGATCININSSFSKRQSCSLPIPLLLFCQYRPPLLKKVMSSDFYQDRSVQLFKTITTDRGIIISLILHLTLKKATW